MTDRNKGSLQSFNCFSSFENFDGKAAELFVRPAVKKMIDNVTKILELAAKNGELKGFKIIEFRLETNVYKKLFKEKKNDS